GHDLVVNIVRQQSVEHVARPPSAIDGTSFDNRLGQLDAFEVRWRFGQTDLCFGSPLEPVFYRPGHAAHEVVYGLLTILLLQLGYLCCDSFFAKHGNQCFIECKRLSATSGANERGSYFKVRLSLIDWTTKPV